MKKAPSHRIRGLIIVNVILCRYSLHYQGTLYLVGEVLEVCAALGIGTGIPNLALYALEGKESVGAWCRGNSFAQALEAVDEQYGQSVLQGLAIVAYTLAALSLGEAEAYDVGNVLVGRVEVVQVVHAVYEK